MTIATWTGEVLLNGTPLGKRGTLIATPAAEGTWVNAGDHIAYGSAKAETDGSGVLQGGLDVEDVDGLLYTLTWEPHDNSGAVALGTYDLSGGGDIAALIETDYLAISETMAAQIAAAAALGATNDTAVASFFNNSVSAARTAADKVYGRGVSVTDPDFGADPTGVADATTAISNAIATGKPVYIPGGTYKVSGVLALTTSGQRITLAPNATIMLTSGYAGDVWRFSGGASQLTGVIVEGGTVKETGKSLGVATVPGSWTLARFKGAGTGSSACTLRDQRVEFPGTAFAFEVTGSGWANGNRIYSIQLFYPAIMLDCNLNGGSQTAFSMNSLRDIFGQSGNYTTYGVKGLTGKGWRLDNVNVWDLGINNPTGSTGQILSTAFGTVITGGQVTIWNYTDAGVDTLVMDLTKRLTISGVAPPVITAKVKTADTSRTNPTDALAADPELSVAVGTNRTYDVELLLFYTASTTGDLTAGWTAPSGSVMTWTAGGLRTAATAASDTVMHNSTTLAGTLVLGGAGVAVAARLAGTLITNAGGTLAFRWTQNTADAVTPTTVSLRSRLRLLPLD